MNILTVLAVVLLGSVYTTLAGNKCNMPTSRIRAFYSVSDNIWRIRLPWSGENPTCNKVELKEETPGSEVYQTISTSHCEAGRYCYFNATKQSCQGGQSKYKSMKIITNCAQDCQGTSTQTFTIGSLFKLANIERCKRVFLPGSKYPESNTELVFKECSRNNTCSEAGYHSGPGCYCGDGSRLNRTTGLCVANDQCPDLEPVIPLNLDVANCTKHGDLNGVVVRWKVSSHRRYYFSIKDSYGTITREGELKSSTDERMGFQVTGSFSRLTIPSTLPTGSYTITVTDIVSDKKYNETRTFSIQKGCKSIEKLLIDTKTTCVQRTPNSEISWNVRTDRSYKFTVSKGGKTVKESTVPGSGSEDFPVDNGRGQLMLELEPGTYTVTVQDLHAGVHDYHTKSEELSVKVCGFEILMNTCGGQDDALEVTIETYQNRLYRYRIVEERTRAIVHDEAGIAGSNDMTTRNIKPSDGLPVGRYLLIVTEVQTGAEGYERFSINSNGKIGADVKYRADPLPDGLYVCLDPREGRLFSSGLTYRTRTCSSTTCTSTPESTLQGEGNCFVVGYSGGKSIIYISVVKKSGDIEEVDLAFRG